MQFHQKIFQFLNTSRPSLFNRKVAAGHVPLDSTLMSTFFLAPENFTMNELVDSVWARKGGWTGLTIKAERKMLCRNVLRVVSN